jgi:exopolysaccharide biosynthesis protein
MRGRARKILAALCVAGSLTATVASGGTAFATGHTGELATGTTATGTTAAASHAWLPSTPTSWPQVVGEQTGKAQTVTGGAQWHTETYQTVGGAQRADVMNVDLTDSNLRFGAVSAGDKLVDPSDETISSMADRTGAIAGVNSDFFAINATGQPDGMLVRNGTLEASPVASWPYDLEALNSGQMEMAMETFSGTVDDTTTGVTNPLVALNRIDQTGLTEVTPYLGAVSIGASTIATGTVSGGVLTITGVQTSQTSLPQLTTGQEDLIARRGTADSTWLQKVHPGDALTVSDSLAPYGLDQIQSAVSGGAYLAQNGVMTVPAQGGGENNVQYPIIGIGVSKDGTHAIMAVFNGRESENQAVGLTRPQFAQWMLAQGAYNAIEFDSGGSAEMVAPPAWTVAGQRPQYAVGRCRTAGVRRPVPVLHRGRAGCRGAFRRQRRQADGTADGVYRAGQRIRHRCRGKSGGQPGPGLGRAAESGHGHGQPHEQRHQHRPETHCGQPLGPRLAGRQIGRRRFARTADGHGRPEVAERLPGRTGSGQRRHPTVQRDRDRAPTGPR